MATIFKYSDYPLPVELVSFGAKANGSSIDLIWVTATETNNYGFFVQKSRGKFTKF